MTPLPAGPFGVVLADPPWSFLTYSGERTIPVRGSHQHYTTLPFDELAALPVGEITAPDAALFLWVVDSHLDEALALGKAWGFAFKTCAFVWVKSKRGGWAKVGMGYWTRKQCEQLWLFTKGKPKRLSKGVEQIIHCPRGPHSAKPEQQYERIEALVGGPYLELFARATRPGWESWGDQVGVRDGPLFKQT